MSTETPLDLKKTVNLPQTGFSQKANLTQSEPARLKKWADLDLYQLIRRTRAGAEKFILHDGPPYANADIHLGTAMNKILKDFIVKSRTMMGFDAPYVPGYDCHGLPIEQHVDETLAKKNKKNMRSQSREFSPRLSRTRAERAEEPDARLQTARNSRRVGKSLSDDVEPLRSRNGADVWPLRRTWLRLQRRCVRFIGAFSIKPRWRKPRLSITSTRALRSM